MRYEQGSVFTTDPWKWILKTDPYPNLVKYSLNVLKKITKALDFFNTDKSCFLKINVELSPLGIWRIRITDALYIILYSYVLRALFNIDFNWTDVVYIKDIKNFYFLFRHARWIFIKILTRPWNYNFTKGLFFCAYLISNVIVKYTLLLF